ncbi:MAG: hypothetical protein JSS09_08160 [Verrucomicrobia bacterium]|nr:hypothetical protein [Verrucomicrobiota bacterium]
MFSPLIHTSTTVTMSLEFTEKLPISNSLYRNQYDNKPLDLQTARYLLENYSEIQRISNLVIERHGLFFSTVVNQKHLSPKEVVSIIDKIKIGSIESVVTCLKDLCD